MGTERGSDPTVARCGDNNSVFLATPENDYAVVPNMNFFDEIAIPRPRSGGQIKPSKEASQRRRRAGQPLTLR